MLLKLKQAEQLPSFVEPKDLVVTVGSDLTKFNETMQPVFKAVELMSEKLGESYTQLSDSAQAFKEKLEKLSESLSKLEKNSHLSNNVAPAQAVLGHKGINEKVPYPCNCGDYKPGRLEATIRSIIIHLNDVHHWKREHIADWLDTLPEQPIYYPDLRTDQEKNKLNEELLLNKKADYGTLEMKKGDKLIVYNNDGSICLEDTAKMIAVWHVTQQPYGGKGYAEVIRKDGSVEHYEPKSVV